MLIVGIIVVAVALFALLTTRRSRTGH